MAIAQTTGSAGNSGASSVSSQAAPSITTTTGQKVVVTVHLGSTASSVSSITPSAGSYTGWTLQIAKNGTGVRVEIWTATVATGAATVFTANITGGATTCAITVEEYNGVTSFGNTGSDSGNTNYVHGQAVLQDENNRLVTAFTFACVSGDTLTAIAGTSRQSTIPAATSVGGALYDQSQVSVGTPVIQSRISTTRQWASASLELRSGSASNIILDYPSGALAATMGTGHDFRRLFVTEPLFAQLGGTLSLYGQTLQTGFLNVAYAETIAVNGGLSPYAFSIIAGALPAGLTINATTGIISGTPTTIGSSTFTVRVADSTGAFATQAFTIVVTSSGGGAFTYLN